MKKILIVGGGGFIGSVLLKRLAREHSCICFGHDRNYSELRESIAGDVEFVAGDLNDAKLVNEVMGAARAVVHVAGSGGEVPCLSDPVTAVLTHVQGTHQLLQAVMRHRIESFVFASTIAVYGTYKARPMPLTEEMDSRPDDFYAALKATAEQMLIDAGHAQILRLANVYGYGTGLHLHSSGVIGKFVEAVLNGKPLQIYGNGSQSIDYVHVDDVAAAFEVALKRPGEQFIYNIGGGQPATIKHLAELTVEIASELKYEPKLIYAEAPPNKIWPDRWLSITKAKAEGWRPRLGLRAGIHELLKKGQYRKR